jgi:hypothetical protein
MYIRWSAVGGWIISMTGSKSVLLAVLVLLCSVFRSDWGFAQTPGTAEGYWSGIVRIPAAPWNVRVWLNRNPAGAWGGTLDSPTEAITDFPLVVTGEGRSTTFRYPGSAASPTFKGTLSADANKITGTFVRDGSSFPFELTRQPGPPQPATLSKSERALTQARRVFELLRQEKFADVAKEFNVQAAAVLPTAALSQKWSALRAQVGAYKSELSKTVDQAGTFTVVTLGCQFERAALNIMIVFGPDEKIGALEFVPRPAAVGAAK